jgi:hypothetical protein
MDGRAAPTIDRNLQGSPQAKQPTLRWQASGFLLVSILTEVDNGTEGHDSPMIRQGGSSSGWNADRLRRRL